MANFQLHILSFYVLLFQMPPVMAATAPVVDDGDAAMFPHLLGAPTEVATAAIATSVQPIQAPRSTTPSIGYVPVLRGTGDMR
jgi:hypothetical protein